jgi:hypothetical protein
MFMIPLCLLASGPGPEINADQFAQIVKDRAESLKTVVFVYQGWTRWVGPQNLGMAPLMFDDAFQGAFLYRDDEAGLMDVYMKKKKPAAQIMRKKRSVLKGQSERIRGLLDAKIPIDPGRDIQAGPGSIASLVDISGTQNLFWSACTWKDFGDLKSWHYVFEGWEEVDGRNCLRFQIDSRRNAIQHNLDYQRFWVDVHRNAQVVRRQQYTRGKLTCSVDVNLVEVPVKNARSIWIPSRSQTLWYVWNNETSPV